jgi:hypothetical protein
MLQKLMIKSLQIKILIYKIQINYSTDTQTTRKIKQFIIQIKNIS